MDLSRFLDLVRTQGWQGWSLWLVLMAQALLWVGLVRLQLSLHREEAPWEECVGKIRSAFLRKVNGEEEIQELKVHRYAPLVDQLLALHFAEQKSDRFDRWLLLRWKAKEGLRPFWIRWGHLVIAFGAVVWYLQGLRLDLGTDALKRTPVDPRLLWVWLGYAMLLAWKIVRLQGNLERVQRSLLLPRREE
ncbi:hypothetical protein [Geothrix sp. 21YS21S-4]|uniref:hypothetical protein n=1 Tax=Geothrix sp. 21YS21S-4 TaxID=3068889 RepID=UPI0027BA0BAC|nr:hypothetical protein [Geothrix sp. 21YS21S-4]